METPESSVVPTQAPAPKNKKLFIAAIAVLGIVIVFILITVLISGGSSTEDENISASPAEQSENSNQQNSGRSSASPAASPTAAENTFSNSFFSINYPLDWEATELTLVGGESGVAIKPKSNQGSSNAIITISTKAKSSADSIQKQQFYSRLGFKNSSITVDGTNAVKMSGTLPPKTASSSASTKFIQTSYISLEKGDQNYIFDYSYVNPNIDIQLENIFSKIIASFEVFRGS